MQGNPVTVKQTVSGGLGSGGSSPSQGMQDCSSSVSCAVNGTAGTQLRSKEKDISVKLAV